MIDICIQFPGLIEAMIQVESDGDDMAIGDKNLPNKAYGCLQIRKPYMDDANAGWKTTYKAEDCLGNRELSIQTVNRYMWRYCAPIRIGHTRTMEDIARIHNGGPNGFKIPLTENYWKLVQSKMQ